MAFGECPVHMRTDGWESWACVQLTCVKLLQKEAASSGLFSFSSALDLVLVFGLFASPFESAFFVTGGC